MLLASLINMPLGIASAHMDDIGQSHPSPRPSPREGRGRNDRSPRSDRTRRPLAPKARPAKLAASKNQPRPDTEKGRDAFSLSPQRGEGRGEGCDWPTASAPDEEVPALKRGVNARTRSRSKALFNFLSFFGLASLAVAQGPNFTGIQRLTNQEVLLKFSA